MYMLMWWKANMSWVDFEAEINGFNCLGASPVSEKQRTRSQTILRQRPGKGFSHQWDSTRSFWIPFGWNSTHTGLHRRIMICSKWWFSQSNSCVQQENVIRQSLRIAFRLLVDGCSAPKLWLMAIIWGFLKGGTSKPRVSMRERSIILSG